PRAEAEAADVEVVRLERDDLAEAFDSEGNSVDAEPGPGRVRGLALEGDAGDQIPEAAELERVVGRLEADDERGLVDSRGRVEQGGERIELRADLLAGEEEEAEVERELGVRGPAAELDHHREAALHVGGAEPVDGAVLDPPGQVPLRRHGVGVAGEEDERPAAAFRVEQRLAVV